VLDWVLAVFETKTLEGNEFLILFQRWRMHALVWSIWSDRGDEVEQMKDEELTGSPVAGLMTQMWDEQLVGKPAVGLMEQIQDEQLAGKPAAGLMGQIQVEQFAGDLVAGLAGTDTPPRAHQSFSRCKTTQCPNPNLAR